MPQQNGYIGRAPGDSAVIIASQTFEPTGIQTDFTFAAGYTVGYLDVYFNGARLIYANDYVAANGTTVGLTTYANNGDVIECVAYKSFNVGSVEEAGGNFSVGNQLTVVGATTATSAYYTGIVTATSFSGDGSSLTGLANTDVINTENINVIGVATVGSGVTINASGIEVTSGIVTAGTCFKAGGGSFGPGIGATILGSGNAVFAGVVTATTFSGTASLASGLTGTPDITVRNVTGVAATFTGVLTYEDVTNVDSVGIVTARGGIEIGAAGVGGTITSVGNAIISGFSTFKNDVTLSGASSKDLVWDNSAYSLTFADDSQLRFGASDDFKLWWDHLAGGEAKISSPSAWIIAVSDTGFEVTNQAENNTSLKAVPGASVELYENNSKKLETTTTGVSIAGTTISSGGDFITYDNGAFKSGNGAEVSLWHNNTATLGENGYLRNLVGNLNINSGNSAGNIYINLDENVAGVTSDRAASFNRNGSVDLYYDNYKKFETLSTGVKVTGITSTTQLTVGPGLLQESFDAYSSALTGTVNHDVLDHGMVLHAATNASASFTINLRGNGSTTFNSLMNIGQSSVFTVYSASNNTSYYLSNFQIDGSSITEKWSGGTAPSAGSGAGVDVYTFNILKTADATFSVYANTANFA